MPNLQDLYRDPQSTGLASYRPQGDTAKALIGLLDKAPYGQPTTDTIRAYDPHQGDYALDRPWTGRGVRDPVDALSKFVQSLGAPPPGVTTSEMPASMQMTPLKSGALGARYSMGPVDKQGQLTHVLQGEFNPAANAFNVENLQKRGGAAMTPGESKAVTQQFLDFLRNMGANKMQFTPAADSGSRTRLFERMLGQKATPGPLGSQSIPLQ